jgi:hypothetical protein
MREKRVRVRDAICTAGAQESQKGKAEVRSQIAEVKTKRDYGLPS